MGEYLPAISEHRGSTMEVFLDRMVYTYDGIFGTPVGVACTYVFMFVLFGQVFNAAGGGNFFFRLAASIAGRMRGGPAKICVIASALYGTLSGSPVSDVVTTGSITIPLMKRLGYGETFSGAVAASACSGASILPPIMGTAAFLMVDVAGIPYIEIACRRHPSGHHLLFRPHDAGPLPRRAQGDAPHFRRYRPRKRVDRPQGKLALHHSHLHCS